MTSMPRACICGMYGFPLNAISCPIHGYDIPVNSRAYAIGTLTRLGRLRIRRIVWGRFLARAEKRDGEVIRTAAIRVRHA